MSIEKDYKKNHVALSVTWCQKTRNIRHHLHYETFALNFYIKVSHQYKLCAKTFVQKFYTKVLHRICIGAKLSCKSFIVQNADDSLVLKVNNHKSSNKK